MIESIREKFTNLEISKGNVLGHSFISRFGKGTVGATNTDIRSESANIIFQTAATLLSVVSSSALDTNSGGTGLRSVSILGLDSNWNSITEIVNLNGTTAVNTVNTFIRVNRVIASSVGSTGFTQGTVNITSVEGTPKQLARILALENAAQFAIFTVPKGFTAFLQRVLVQNGATDTTEINMQVRASADVSTSPFITFHSYQIFEFASEIDWDNFIKVNEKSDIKFSGKALSATDLVSVSFTLMLVNNNCIESLNL